MGWCFTLQPKLLAIGVAGMTCCALTKPAYAEYIQFTFEGAVNYSVHGSDWGQWEPDF